MKIASYLTSDMANFLSTIFRKYPWAINLLFIFLGNYFVANALQAIFNHTVFYRLPSVYDIPASERRAETKVASGKTSASSIAQRNFMALKRENIQPATLEQQQSTPEPALSSTYAEGDLKPCTIAGVLKGTLVSDAHPEWSIAVVFNNNSRDSQIYSIDPSNNNLGNDATLVEIRSREIIVRRKDHYERCTGEGEGEGSPAVHLQATAAVDTSASDEGGDLVAGDMTGVTKLSDSDYKVERNELDKVLNNLNEVAMHIRLVPSFRNGKPNGFKAFNIRSGSIFSKIGLQNGDVIQKINGHEMNSPDRALELYSKLREMTSLTVELQRRGQNVVMNYTIR